MPRTQLRTGARDVCLLLFPLPRDTLSVQNSLLAVLMYENPTHSLHKALSEFSLVVGLPRSEPHLAPCPSSAHLVSLMMLLLDQLLLWMSGYGCVARGLVHGWRSAAFAQ